MSPKHTSALDSPRLTASQRGRLILAGQRHDRALEKAHRAYDRAVEKPMREHDLAVTEAQALYDADVAVVLAELVANGGASS